MTILDFSVFIFDLDGVVINSEFIHYECYKQAFKNEINYELNWDEYCKIIKKYIIIKHNYIKIE